MHQRKSDRHNYRTSVIIEAGEEQPGAAASRKIFHVPTRNVSKAGLGFVAPPVFMPRVLSDRTLLVRTELMFRVGTQVKVKLGSADGKMPTLTVEGPDDTGRGRWIPTTSVDEYGATLASWFGVSATNLSVAFPNIGRFAKPNLGFL